MKICIVGLGQAPIPPKGWGAVEILIWDYKQTLEKLGHEVVIVNTPIKEDIIKICNSESPDFIHVHYDVFWDICEKFECENVAITSHYGYLDQKERYDYGFIQIFNGILSLKKTRIFSLSHSNTKAFIEAGFSPSRIKTIPNGVRTDLFKFKEECHFPDKSIYLAKIEPRKRQHMFQHIPNLYFAGGISDSRYGGSNYLGELGKEFLYDRLTDYANLVLLSDGEAHPLVCLEAMSSGLGLVLSEYSTANLNLELPFIDVIPESKINDINYIESVIKENREKSVTMRGFIRKYVTENFCWDYIINEYLKTIEEK